MKSAAEGRDLMINKFSDCMYFKILKTRGLKYNYNIPCYFPFSISTTVAGLKILILPAYYCPMTRMICTPKYLSFHS